MSVEDPDVADYAASAVLDELNTRKGYDQLWDEVPLDVRNDIKEALAVIIRNHYEGAGS